MTEGSLPGGALAARRDDPRKWRLAMKKMLAVLTLLGLTTVAVPRKADAFPSPGLICGIIKACFESPACYESLSEADFNAYLLYYSLFCSGFTGPGLIKQPPSYLPYF
jgi:hypothetical protein